VEPLPRGREAPPLARGHAMSDPAIWFIIPALALAAILACTEPA
jgi:hypothetical protein